MFFWLKLRRTNNVGVCIHTTGTAAASSCSKYVRARGIHKFGVNNNVTLCNNNVRSVRRKKRIRTAEREIEIVRVCGFRT